MRKLFAFGLTFLALSYLALLVVFTASPKRLYSSGEGWFQTPCDFGMRLNEVKCLRMGIDPFDVWHGDKKVKPFLPNWGEARVALGGGGGGYTEYINAYAPWEYMVMLPLSFLGRKSASAIYFFTMLGSLSILFSIGLGFIRRQIPKESGAFQISLAELAILCSAIPILQDFISGNLSLISVTGIALMACALNAKKDILAGFCWAIGMLKPQLGLIFAIPLLLRRKWLVCFTASIVCLILTIPPAIMCNVSPLKLILETPAANTFAFNGCGSAPYILLEVLPRNVVIYTGLALGVALCLLMTSRVSKAEEENQDWLIYLMPAAVCAMSWSYSQCYAHAFCWFYFLILIVELAKYPKSRFLWVVAAFSLFSLTRVYNFAHTLINISGVLEESGINESVHYTIDSLNSTLDILLCLVFCAWRKRCEKQR